MDGRLEQRVVDWLTTQGYPLEFSAAAAFQEAGFSVTHADYYVDPTDSGPREIDLVAEFGEADIDRLVMFRLNVAIECKSSASKPWVLLTSGRPLTRPWELARGRITNSAGEAWIELLMLSDGEADNGLLAFAGPVAFGLVKARLDRDAGNNPGRGDPAFQALHACVNAATWLVRDLEDQSIGHETNILDIHVALPLVVVSDPLLRCHMGADHALCVERVVEGDLLWRHPASGHRGTPVKVIAESHLAAYAAGLKMAVVQAFRSLPKMDDLRAITANIHRERAARGHEPR
jgi:hypothetical protein